MRPRRHAALRRLPFAAVLGRVVSGDRPYVLAFFCLLAVLAMMIVGPLQSYTAAAERVHDLAATKAELSERVRELQERRGRLDDPEHLELLARERLGLVRPGEIPYVVSDGEPESDQVRPDGQPPPPSVRPSLWQRILAAFSTLFAR